MAIGPAPAAEVAPAPAPVRRLPVRRLNVWAGIAHGTWARGIFAALHRLLSGRGETTDLGRCRTPRSIERPCTRKLQEEGFHARIIPFPWSECEYSSGCVNGCFARDLARSDEDPRRKTGISSTSVIGTRFAWRHYRPHPRQRKY